MRGGGQPANNVTSKVRHQGTPKDTPTSILAPKLGMPDTYLSGTLVIRNRLRTVVFFSPRNRLVACIRIALFWRSQ